MPKPVASVLGTDRPVAVSVVQEAGLNPTGRSALAPVVTRSGCLSGRFGGLRLFFLRLTHYGRDRLKRFAVPEIH